MTSRHLIDVSDVVAADEDATRSTESPRYGLTDGGFVPKPFARLLAERIAVANEVFGGEVDLSSGAVLRKILELSALEDARIWGALATTYDNCFVATATGNALSLLGDELGLPRPHKRARGRVALVSDGQSTVVVPRGCRLITSGGHHVATESTVALNPASPRAEVGVVAFYPGPSHNLDPSAPSDDGGFPQRIRGFHPLDPKRPEGAEAIAVEHELPLTGGDQLWEDARYRALLQRAPRSVWTARAVETAVELVPGVRSVQLRDPFGGLDVEHAIFGTFNFLERLFGTQRDELSVYQAKLLVAPTQDAIVDGIGGLRDAIRVAIEDVRPLGIHPEIRLATQVPVGVRATVGIRGVPLPIGSAEAIAQTEAVVAIRKRLRSRLRESVHQLSFGDAVSAAKLTWALMSDPEVGDVRDLQVLRFANVDSALATGDARVALACGANLELQVDEIAEFLDLVDDLQIERAR
ncbi:MAG: hypothetical protein AAGF12_22130 [Myxococcota bacterium]